MGSAELLMALLSFPLAAGQADDERGALPRGAAGCDRSAMPLDNLAADSQPHPGALVFPPAVQAMEGGEDPVQVLFIETDAVVLHGDLAHLFGGGAVRQHPALDLQHGGLVRPVKLERVTDEVLQ